MACSQGVHTRLTADFEGFVNITGLTATERERAANCWSEAFCWGCINNKNLCGWCPTSNTCHALHTSRTARAFPLLANIGHCPNPDDKYEIRTRGLGCSISTATVLTSVVTFFATIVFLLLLYGIGKCLSGYFGFLRGSRNGWELKLEEDRRVERGHTWVRGPDDETIKEWKKAKRAEWWDWAGFEGREETEEERPLLGQY